MVLLCGGCCAFCRIQDPRKQNVLADSRESDRLHPGRTRFAAGSGKTCRLVHQVRGSLGILLPRAAHQPKSTGKKRARSNSAGRGCAQTDAKVAKAFGQTEHQDPTFASFATFCSNFLCLLQSSLACNELFGSPKTRGHAFTQGSEEKNLNRR